MSGITLPQAYLAAVGVLTGVGIHHGLFIKGEWHIYAPDIVRSYGSIFLCIAVARFYFSGTEVGDVFGGLALASVGHVLGIFASILVYRIFFHRLNKTGIPGPFWARTSKLWHVWFARDSKNHQFMEKLYSKYGDFIRTGPAEVTVFRPEAIAAVGGHGTECIKGEFYDLLSPNKALFSARDRVAHKNRRRDWQYGFSSAAIVHHEAKVLQYLTEFDNYLEAQARTGTVVEATDTFWWYTFDVMGDFTLSKSFGMLENRSWHKLILKLKNARVLLGPLAPTPWLLHLGLKLLPRVLWVRDWYDSVEWCAQQMEERLAKGHTEGVPDLTHYFMERPGQKDQERAKAWLTGDSLLAILAGSEPTAQALSAIFQELAVHPEHAEKLREELIGISVTDKDALARLPHLGAVINESMRLHPSLITGGARKTTENGVWIGETFIPPHTTVITPRWIISKREDCFERGNEFIPERWSTRPEMVRNAAAFSPFSIGQYNCIGQQLSMTIMRYTISRIVTKYNFRFAPGETGASMDRDLEDRFTSFPGRLPLVFELREPTGEDSMV